MLAPSSVQRLAVAVLSMAIAPEIGIRISSFGRYFLPEASPCRRSRAVGRCRLLAMRAVPSCLSPNAFALVRRNAAHVDEHADGLVELSGRAPQAEYLLGTSDAAGYGIDDREGILIKVRPASRGGSPRLSRRSVPAKLAGDGEKAIVAERNDADVAIGGRGERGKSGPIHGRRTSGSWSRQTFRHRPSVIIHGCLFRSTN